MSIPDYRRSEATLHRYKTNSTAEEILGRYTRRQQPEKIPEPEEIKHDMNGIIVYDCNAEMSYPSFVER